MPNLNIKCKRPYCQCLLLYVSSLWSRRPNGIRKYAWDMDMTQGLNIYIVTEYFTIYYINIIGFNTIY